MSKLYIDQKEYDEMVGDSRTVTGPYIAVDAYVTGTMSAAEAIVLGDLWHELRKIETNLENDVFEGMLSACTIVWGMAFPDNPLPTGSEIEVVLDKIRKYVIDRIYQIEEKHD